MTEDVGSRRKRFTPAERLKILADYKASGLTQRAFADRAGVSLSCLSIWLRRQKQSAPETTPSAFLELPPPPGAPAGYKFQWPGGLSLELPRGFSPAEARELLQLARAL